MALKGKGLSLFMDMGAEYAPVGMAMDASLHVNADAVEMAALSSRARAYKAGRYGWRITCAALYCADPLAKTYAQQLHTLRSLTQGAMLKVVFTEVLPYDGELHAVSLPSVEYVGDAIVTGYSINAPVQGYANISIELQGTGDLEVAELDTIDGGKASTTYTDEIDGGDATTVFTNTLEGGQSI